jgi:hypothetical protein
LVLVVLDQQELLLQEHQMVAIQHLAQLPLQVAVVVVQLAEVHQLLMVVLVDQVVVLL